MGLITQSIVNGILIGGVYSIIAVGLSLSFGVMRIVNWAHGECLMVSMFIAYLIVTYFGFDPYITLILTGIIMFIVGYLLQKGIFNKMIKRDKSKEPLSILLFTIGMGMVLSNLTLIIFGSNPLMAQTAYSGETFSAGDIVFSIPKMISFFLAILFTLGLYIFLQKAEMGRAIRALSQNRDVAGLMGINVERLYCVAFGVGLGLVGVAGSLLTPFYPVYPTVGHVFGTRAFLIVVLGGKGSVPGALIGGLLVGLIEQVGAAVLTPSYAEVIKFVLFIGILLIKPNGLLSKVKEQ